jgi:hypothetical protein
MGFRLAILPAVLLKPVVEACDAALASVKATRQAPSAGGAPIHEMFRRFGADEWDTLRKQFES